MKIGIIADIHLPKKERPPRPEPGKKPEPIPDDPTTAKVKAFYEKAKTENYDFVINLGDVVGNSGDADHDYMTASMFSRSMIGSTVNTYHVLGNRDCMSFPKDLLLHCNETLGSAYWFKRDDTLFVALDAHLRRHSVHQRFYRLDGFIYPRSSARFPQKTALRNRFQAGDRSLPSAP